MKDFKRENKSLSLCGLNCSLCTMNIGGYCPGCGCGEGNQPCAIARCSVEHDHVQHCTQCRKFPCSKYDGITEYDSFIVHRNMRKDLEKFQQIGEKAYNQEQAEKRRILDYLLEHYNNGRKKTFYSIAVNLFEVEDLRKVIAYTKSDEAFKQLTLKEQIIQISSILQAQADAQGYLLKLNKKK